MNRYASTWRQDDVVSTPGVGVPVTGKVIVLKRESDGREYRKVQITSGGALGRWVWPDGWVLGAGAFGRTCLDCRQPFRTPLGGEEFCPACNRHERPNTTAPETRSISGSLYGARTPRATGAPVTVPPVELFENPFGEAK